MKIIWSNETYFKLGTFQIPFLASEVTLNQTGVLMWYSPSSFVILGLYIFLKNVCIVCEDILALAYNAHWQLRRFHARGSAYIFCDCVLFFWTFLLNRVMKGKDLLRQCSHQNWHRWISAFGVQLRGRRQWTWIISRRIFRKCSMMFMRTMCFKNAWTLSHKDSVVCRH